MRGTALLATHGFLLTNIAKTLSGRSIAADFSGVQFINVYAPSGTARWMERENIFNSELPELFYPTSYPILGGDFNLLCTQPTPPFLSPQVESFEKLSVASL